MQLPAVRMCIITRFPAFALRARVVNFITVDEAECDQRRPSALPSDRDRDRSDSS
jgi:hypothetical protein